MNITFSMNSDGSIWSYEPASIGYVRTGPMGMIGILETRLGLSGEACHLAERIDQYMKRMQEKDNENIWFHKSFSIDPWSTAKQMLHWRDELVAAGWKGQEFYKPSERLNALYIVENSGLPLSEGVSDRIRNIAIKLKSKQKIHISSIRIEDDFEILPPVWKEIFLSLENIGVEVIKEKSISHDQVFMKEDLFSLVEANDEWEAADNIAIWLSADKLSNKNVTIICGMDTSILDQSLRLYGLPTLGNQEPSRWREIQQVLPLFLSNAWLPVDIRQLAELLSLTTSPFPQWICNRLLKAISKEPGIGGTAWQEAIEDIRSKLITKFLEKNDSDAVLNAEKIIDEIDRFLLKERFDPKTGIPETNLKSRCQKIIDWFSWQLGTDPNVREIVSHARNLQSISVGKGKIPKVLLERMLDTIIGEGSFFKGNEEQAAAWKIADHPGQVDEKCDVLIWWGFNDISNGNSTYWTDWEVSSFDMQNIKLDLSQNIRKREEESWIRALNNVDKKFIGVYIKELDGEESYHHPLWDNIIQKIALLHPELSSEEISNKYIGEFPNSFESIWQFEGRKIALSPIEKKPFMESFPSAKIDKGAIQYPERVSYSQISTLVGCPMKWSLGYHAKVKISERHSIPQGNQMLGNFCHRIVEVIYKDNLNQPNAKQARIRAAELFDLLVPSMASELLLEGRSIDLYRYKGMIVQSITMLVEIINKLSLKVESTEEEISGDFEKINIKGFADLVLRDESLNRYIIDLKWTSSVKYREEEVLEGSALQLATYSNLFKLKEPEISVYAGYYMLAQCKMITPDRALSERAIESKRSLDKTFEMGINSLKDTMEEILEGNIRAKGLEEYLTKSNTGISENKLKKALKAEHESKDLLYIDPPCKFCDFATVCGLPGGEK